MCNVFEEAVRASTVRIHFVKGWYSVVKDKAFLKALKYETIFADKWITPILKANLNKLYPPPSIIWVVIVDSRLKNASELLDQTLIEMVLQSRMPSVKDLCLYRCLELERLQLMYGPIGANYIESISSESQSTLWCIYESKEQAPMR